MYDPEFLISLYFNGNGAFEQEHMDQLSEWIQQDPENAVKFVHAAFLHRAIHDSLAGEDIQTNILSGNEDSDMFWDADSWQALAEKEKIAPEVHKEKPTEKSVEPVLAKTVKPERKISSFSIYTLTLSAAAILLLMLMFLFTPVRPVVGVLTDSINAEWISTEEIPAKGEVLSQGELTLVRGLAEITFDDGAVVIVEAPAVIELESPKSMFVHSGKISAVVSEYATGFTVNTLSASIVDLGTEFGVSVEGDGSCSLHMFKGKASLIAGRKGQRRTSQIINVDEARSVDLITGQVEDIKLGEKSFVRRIDSQKGFIWRGERFNLVDIVGGGNGFGTSRHSHVIDPTTGNVIPFRDRSTDTRFIKLKYNPVQALDFVDGVFIPDGGDESVIISSEGHLFENCPDTEGATRKDIATLDSVYQTEDAVLQMDQIYYGTIEHPAISMHANKGITFDLKAIRDSMPKIQITRFKALCGIVDANNPEQVEYKAGFWILVDGKLMDSFPDARFGIVHSIDIPITQDSRYLTLITTDGGDNIHNDRCIFAEPVLVLEPNDYTNN